MEEDVQRLTGNNGQPSLNPLHAPAREPKVTKLEQGDSKIVRNAVRTDITEFDGPMASPFDYKQVRESMGIDGEAMAAQQGGGAAGAGEAAEEKKRVEEQQYHVIVPSTAAWFSYNGLNEVETTALPEFFNSSNPAKRPEVYVQASACATLHGIWCCLAVWWTCTAKSLSLSLSLCRSWCTVS